MGHDAHQRPTILIVEDDAALRDLFEILLDMEGYAVDAVEHGAQALAYLRAHPPPCCILLDMEMPVMDGPTFRRAQQQDPELATLPVIIMMANPYAIDQATALNPVAVLLKPFDHVRLATLLARICRK